VFVRELYSSLYSRDARSLLHTDSVAVDLQQSIDGLNVQIDQFESEIEGIVSKKKKLDREVSVLFVMPTPWGHNSLMAIVCQSACLSVPCLILSPEWKSVGSQKLAGRKHMTR